MIGGCFKGHGPEVQVAVLNQNSTCPSCQHLGMQWPVFDEIYQWNDFDSSNMQRLLSLDELILNAEDARHMKATRGDYPVA
jgi:hypothetical protein